jgi:hypothetical protein
MFLAIHVIMFATPSVPLNFEEYAVQTCSIKLQRIGIQYALRVFIVQRPNSTPMQSLSTLKSLHYSGDWRNFTFDKYCTAHVDQHNPHAALAEWNVKPLEETMKIHYFEEGITDPSFASVKSTILVDRTKFQDFDMVMRLYLNYKCLQKAEALTHQACNVSALQGCGGSRQGRGGRGRGK